MQNLHFCCTIFLSNKTNKLKAMKQIYRTLIMMALAITMSCQFANAQLKAVETHWGLKDSKNGRLRTQHFIDAQQRKQGLEKRWNADGILMEQLAWKDDVMHGEHVIYYGPSGLGKIDSKLKYDMGIMIEEQRFGKPDKYTDNGSNVQMPYQMTIHRKWQIVNRETGERKLVLEKEWSPYYAKLVECLVTRPNGDIVYTNPVTGEYGLQKSNETVMTLYKDNTMKQITGKQGDGYELRYEYYDPNHDRNTYYNLPETYNVSNMPIKKITETWTSKDDRVIKEIVTSLELNAAEYRTKAQVPGNNSNMSAVLTSTTTYNENRESTVSLKYVYEDGVTVTWSKQDKYKSYDKDDKLIYEYVEVKPQQVTIELASKRYGLRTATFECGFVKDNYTFAVVSKDPGMTPARPLIIKDIAINHKDVYDALAQSMSKVIESSDRSKDLGMCMYKDDNTYEVWSKTPHALSDIVYNQLDSLCQIYNMVCTANEFQYPYQRLWLNDFKNTESELIEKVLNRKSKASDIVDKMSMWYVYIDMHTMSGKLVLDLNHGKTYDINFDKNGLSEAVRTFIRNYNNDYPMSDDERKAFLKDLKKRQRAANGNSWSNLLK